MPVLKTERYRRPDGQGRNIMSVEMKDLTGCINPDKMHWKYAIKRQRDPERVRNVAGETGLILPETFEFQQSRFKERASLRQQTQGTAKGRGQRRKNCVRGNIGSVFRCEVFMRKDSTHGRQKRVTDDIMSPGREKGQNI